MSAGLDNHVVGSFDQHMVSHGLTTVYEEANELATSDSDDSECTISLATDDTCTDATMSTKTSSRGKSGTSLAEELLNIFDAKLRAHKDEVQVFLEERCGELSTMIFRESDWRRNNMESSLNACNRRLDHLDTLMQERRNELSAALLSESDCATRLHGAECKLANLERRVHDLQGTKPLSAEPTKSTESGTLERLQEHIESNTEFLRSFIERESGMISSLSEGLRKSDDKHLALERKLDDVSRFLEDMMKEGFSKGATASSRHVIGKLGSEPACTSGSVDGADADGALGSISTRRSQRPPITRTVSASYRASDLLASRDRIRRLQSAPLLAQSSSVIAERPRSPNASPQHSHGLKKNTPTSSPQTCSSSLTKRRVTPRSEDRRSSK